MSRRFWARRSDLPEGWTDLRDLGGLRFDIVYASEHNFTGSVVPGYEAPGAWLHARPAAALAKAQAAVAESGFGILVFDAYRPRRASEHFVDWAGRNGKSRLVREGYIAKHSLHNRGIALDLGLYALESGAPVDMGGPFDSFDQRAHFAHATGDALTARRCLRRAMQARGFRPYGKEWWHFTYAVEGFEAPASLDRPYRS